MSGRIFISSTCYDLLDARAEIEAAIKDMGLSPVMSDRPTSEFDVTGYRDSIATCLANVRDSDAFVCILSQRYGPRLGGVGYKDVSATHLEYLEAQDSKRPIFFYVRDRLAGDYATWRANRPEAPPKPGLLGKFKKKPSTPDLKLPWVPKGNEGIFELLHSHQELVMAGGATDATNWYTSFKDSIELKAILKRDLRARSRPALLRRMIDEGRAPALVIRSTGADRQPDGTVVTLMFSCGGRVAAIRPEFAVFKNSLWGEWKRLGSDITSSKEASQNVKFPPVPKAPKRAPLSLAFPIRRSSGTSCAIRSP